MSFAGGRGTSLPLGIAGVSPAARWRAVGSGGCEMEGSIPSLKPSLKQTASLPLKKMVLGKIYIAFFEKPFNFQVRTVVSFREGSFRYVSL